MIRCFLVLELLPPLSIWLNFLNRPMAAAQGAARSSAANSEHSPELRTKPPYGRVP